MKKSFALWAVVSLLFTVLGFTQNSPLINEHQGKIRDLKSQLFSNADIEPGQTLCYKNLDSSADGFGDAPETEWMKKFDGSGKDIINKAVADESGNIYIAGGFSGIMEFAGTILESVGKRDVFVAKLDDSGNLLWLKQGSCGEFNSGDANDIVIANDKIYVTGYFDGPVFSMGESSVYLIGLSDALLIQLSPSGEIEMLFSYTNSGLPYKGLALAIDGNQNIYITGSTSGTFSYWSPSFLVKFNHEGILIWWQEHNIAFNDLAVFGDQIYVAGSAYSEAYLGGILLDPNVYADAFVARANLDGEYEWVVMGEHEQVTWGDSYTPFIEVGVDGDVYMAGYFRNHVEFGGFSLSSGSTDAFMVKLNSSGDVLWAKATINTHNSLYGFTLLPDDRLCISGGMAGSNATFDDIVLENPDGLDGNYIAIYSSLGNAQSAFAANHQTSCLAVLPENKILQTGTTGLDAFLAKYEYSGSLLNMDISNGNSGTAQLTGLEIDDQAVIYSLSNVFGHTDFFGLDLNTTKETMVLSGQKPNGDVLWIDEMEGGISWWNFTETTLKLDKTHQRLFLHGEFKDTLKIGNLEFINPFGSSFLAFYTTDGEFKWAKELPYDGITIKSVDADASGNVYYIFDFFGTIEIEGISFTAYQDGDALLMKYDINGNFISASQIETDVFFYSLGIATIQSGGYFLTLEPAGDTIFFNDGNDNLVLTPNDGRSIAAKFDEQGNYLWAKSFGYSPSNYGGFYCWPTASVTDEDGNLYLTGTHGESAHFDDIVLETPYNRYSPYTAKIDGNGNVLWANSIQIHRWGNNYCEAEIDHQGNFYCMGDIVDTIHFGDWQYIPTGPRDMYVVRYDNNGELDWVKIIESTMSGNHFYGMAVFEPDNLFAGGNFTNRIIEGEHELYTTSSRGGLFVHLGDSIASSSVDDNNLTEIFMVAYPNPTGETLYLDFKTEFQHVCIELSDINGRLVKTQIFKTISQTQMLELKGLPGGMYLMKITADGKTGSRKILIQ
ncbi:MAG: T9SS type A sorting domain-containing protein [Bacteroidales bacterium]|nr:T9SS type A sorting domain-containing protein [Bacteroidales bacterium]